MPGHDQIVLDSQLEEIRKLGPWLIEALPRASNDPAIALLELVLVELVSNTIRHGHASEAGHAISLHLELVENCLVRIQICDRGKPIPGEILDNRTRPLDYVAEDIQMLPESGLGLAMVQATVDRLEYRTAPDGNNVTTIEKTIGHPQEL